MASAYCYSVCMLRVKIRCMSILLMALIFAVGLATHGFGAPDIIGKSAMTGASDMPMSGDMPMLGKCNGCPGDEKGVAPTACSAYCGAMIVVPLASAALHAVPAETINPVAASDAIGRTDPPDPYPPRPISMS